MHTHPAESLFQSVTLSRHSFTTSHLCCKKGEQQVLALWRMICLPHSLWMLREALTAASGGFPVLFYHFFIKFPNSHPLAWAQASPGQTQSFLGCLRALFAQRLKILQQAHLTWGTIGVRSQKGEEPYLCWSRSLILQSTSYKQKFIALCCPQIAPPPHTCTNKMSNQNIRSPNSLSKEKHSLTLLTEYLW